MLELAKIRTQKDEFIKKLESKNVKTARESIEEVLTLDAERRKIQQELDELRAETNKVSKSIGMLMKEGNKEAAEEAKKRTGDIKSKTKELEEKSKLVEGKLENVLLSLPNTPHESVPVGKSADDNVVVSEHPLDLKFDFELKPHWELATSLDIINWELGAKITGAGFPVYKGMGARLQRALISFFLDKATEQGYMEVQPPLMVNADSAFATGQLPDKEGQMYTMERDDLYLIPTAEVPITNIFRGDILKEGQLPMKACGYTPCFRREAGSYGKDVKGLNRLHQFDKVELVQITHPDKSYEVLEEMTSYVESLLEALNLPYRRLLLCTGDSTFTSAKTYDLEVLSLGQDNGKGRWLEVSSVSNFETYQSNRLKLRFRNENKKTQLAHTLNGSALALPRIVASLLERYQQKDGSVQVPEVLQAYMGTDVIR